jgi:hypothetical protein
VLLKILSLLNSLCALGIDTSAIYSLIPYVSKTFILRLFRFWHSEDCSSWHILIIKPTRSTNFSNLFLEKYSKCFGQFLCLSSEV